MNAPKVVKQDGNVSESVKTPSRIRLGAYGLLLSLLRETCADETILALFETLSVKISADVEELTGNQIEARPGTAWSVAMILEHMNIVNRGIADAIESLSSERQYDQRVDLNALVPTEVSGDHARAQYREACGYYSNSVRGSITRNGSLESRHTLKHPWFGPLDAKGWHALALMHSFAHFLQIHRTLRKQ